MTFGLNDLLLKHVIEGKRGTRLQQLLQDVKGKRRY
jgi:hypothetical protein